MSVFGSIMSKIFNHPKAKAQPQGAPSATAHGTPASTVAPVQTAQASPAAFQPQAMSQVDVEAVLQTMEDDGGQNLDWRHSIVDLLKLLSIDSSLAARKELAGELGYTGDTGDSAAMNIWLHKQVMAKLSENGGIVPDSLR